MKPEFYYDVVLLQIMDELRLSNVTRGYLRMLSAHHPQTYAVLRFVAYTWGKDMFLECLQFLGYEMNQSEK